MVHCKTVGIRTVAVNTIPHVAVMACAFKAARCIRALGVLVTTVCVLGTFVYIYNV